MRKIVAKELKKLFNPEVFFTVHWNGKMMPPMKNTKKIHRLAIVVSGRGITKLLGVPIIQSSTGEAQAQAVFEYIQD